MSEVRSTTWVRSFIGRAQANGTAPPPVKPERPADNVVHLPRPSLDDRAERIRNLDNQLMVVAIDIDRLGLRFNTIRQELMRERESILADLKETGIKGEFVYVPPEAELMEPSSE